MIALLDVNVLVALFDRSHVHHEAAHGWLASYQDLGWATCPLTENGLVRIVSSPSFGGTTVTVEAAISLLSTWCEDDRHTFWSDALSIRERALLRPTHIRGHRQVTDAYLLALAVHNGGRLATFDRGIDPVCVAGASATNLALIGA